MLLLLRGINGVPFFTALAWASVEARAPNVSYSSPEPGGTLGSRSAQYVIRFDGWVDNRAFQLDVTRTEGHLIDGPRFARRSGHFCPPHDLMAGINSVDAEGGPRVWTATPDPSTYLRSAQTIMRETLAMAQAHNIAAEVKASSQQPPRVVIVGAGFAGVAAAQALRRRKAEVVLIDRRNHYIFQPLLYQVATAVLPPSTIAAPIRQLVRKQKNLSVMMAEATRVDLNSRSLEIICPVVGTKTIAFDYLVLATGMRPSYFGHDEFAKHAPGLKTLTDAEAIRAKILGAYEAAEATDDAGERARQMTFVLVGAGPSGVELAASIALMGSVTLRSNFRRIDPAKTSIVLIEHGERILPSFAESLSKKAARRLEKLGVTVMTGTRVEHVDEQGVIAGGKRIESATVLWTAGVAPSPILSTLGVATDHAGRVCVGPLLNIPDKPEIFVIGDAAAAMQRGRPLPGVAQVAIQQGRYVGHFISAVLNDSTESAPFWYSDRGNLAVVGMNFAILETRRVRLGGVLAYWIWALVHIMSLPQPQNRRRLRTQWLWSYFTGQRGARLIPEDR